MSTTETQGAGADTTTEAATGERRASVVDAVFDIGTQWAALGLNLGKVALEQSARTLEATAKSLEVLAKELEAKAVAATETIVNRGADKP